VSRDTFRHRARHRVDRARFAHRMVSRDRAAEDAASEQRGGQPFTREMCPLCDGPVEFDRSKLTEGA
jgi:hypothetical protein